MPTLVVGSHRLELHRLRTSQHLAHLLQRAHLASFVSITIDSMIDPLRR